MSTTDNMTLRDQCVEAGVRSQLWENDDLDNAAFSVGLTLDAILDVLEQVEDEMRETQAVPYASTRGLIAVLRGDQVDQ